MGANEYLLYEALKKLDHRDLQNSNKTNEETESTVKSEESEEAEDITDSYVLTLTQKVITESQSDSEGKECHQTLFEECSQIAELDLTAITTTAPIVIVQSLKKNDDPMALQRTLMENKPNNVILYATDISTIRQLEVYQNSNPSIKLTVYFLIYGGSVEEQAYLTALRREKEAFHTLINAKKTMVVPEDQDGKSETCSAFATESENAEQNSRKGDQANNQNIVSKVIVDMREFRSELPIILHSRGIQIEPITISVGDYILSPEICVERKSVSDLIGSLNSGRLYTQVVAMTRHYTKPMLLIEFDPNKPFCFQGKHYLGKDIKSFHITEKLQLLTLHFPKLKLIWSPSPHASAQLFEELKAGREQPDAEKAAQIGIFEHGEDTQIIMQKYNSNIHDFISKLPGVHTKNVCTILNQGKSLDHLIKLTEDELAEMIGNKTDAQMLYSSIHEQCLPAEDAGRRSLKNKSIAKGCDKKLFSKIKK